MSPTKFESALALIDKENNEDPNTYKVHGITYPKELLYAQRMTRQLLQFKPDASQALQIAARAQHICRWKIARDAYPINRVGYLKWREDLKKMHAQLTASILNKVGYNSAFIDEVSLLITKKLIKKNKDSQTLEDVVCLVFLNYYFEAFAVKHDKEKVISILKKTWAKMSDDGHKEALKIKFSQTDMALIKQII